VSHAARGTAERNHGGEHESSLVFARKRTAVPGGVRMQGLVSPPGAQRRTATNSATMLMASFFR